MDSSLCAKMKAIAVLEHRSHSIGYLPWVYEQVKLVLTDGYRYAGTINSPGRSALIEIVGSINRFERDPRPLAAFDVFDGTLSHFVMVWLQRTLALHDFSSSAVSEFHPKNEKPYKFVCCKGYSLNSGPNGVELSFHMDSLLDEAREVYTGTELLRVVVTNHQLDVYDHSG